MAIGLPSGPSGSTIEGILPFGLMRQILGRELLAVRADVDLVHVVGQAALLEHDGDLAAVGRAPGIEFDHGEVAGDVVLGAGDSIGGDAVAAADSRSGACRATSAFRCAAASTTYLSRAPSLLSLLALGDRPASLAARRSRRRPTSAAARAQPLRRLALRDDRLRQLERLREGARLRQRIAEVRLAEISEVAPCLAAERGPLGAPRR